MTKIIDRVFFDWGKDRIFGWQLFTNFKKVAGMANALELGYELPDVDVVERDGVYFLCKEQKSNTRQWGGHSRTAARYIIGRGFSCNLWDKDRPGEFRDRKYYEIKDAVFRDSLVPYPYYGKLKEVDARVVAKNLGDSIWEFQSFLDSGLK